MQIVTAALIGLLFGIGIIVAGMSNPAKVLNFFDVAGTWDPSLAFVMGGALAVTFIGYRVVLGWPHPVLSDTFSMPGARRIDATLIGGAAVFVIGWGLSGFCPGGLIPALGTGRAEPAIFFAGLVAGIVAAKAARAAAARRV